MDDTKQRNDNDDEEEQQQEEEEGAGEENDDGTDTPWPRGEIFREAIAITARAKLGSCARAWAPFS